MKFYTDIISDELTKKLKGLGYPVQQADMGFTLPQIVDLNPTYAEVLDWLLEKEIYISIVRISDEKWFVFFDKFKPTLIHKKGSIDESFKNSLEKILSLALDFINN